jgi:DinB superfamily
MDNELLKYPIGKFTPSDSYSPQQISDFIRRIESLPAKVEAALAGLTDAQLDIPYRDGGWTVRQVAHHLADSHLNAYIRFKWTLTEETPTIKAYDEKAWAVTPETHSDPTVSVALLKSLHHKWVILLKSIAAADLSRQFYHPDSKKYVSIGNLMGTYAWHGEHHLAHIASAKEKMKA